MNDNKNKIIREEFARAMMIKKAQSVLSESAFRGFVHEMRKYEQNMIITEGLSSENIYDGFQKQLQEQTAEVGREGEIIANKYGKEGNMTADAVKKRPTGGGGKDDGNDKGKGDEKKSADIKKFMDRLSKDSKKKLEALRISDPVKAARYIMKNPDQFESYEEMEADAFIRSETARVTGKDPGSSFDAPEEPTGDVKKDTENLGKELESPKAKGILASIFDSYKFAFAANAKMWEKIYSFIAGIGDKPPAQQAQAAQQAADNLDKNVPTDEEAGRTAEDPDGDGEAGGGEQQKQGKANTVRNVRRDVMQALNTVLDRFDEEERGIDMSRRDSQELVKTLADNIIDQLRTNGVQFKGLNEAVYNAVHTRLLKEDEELSVGRLPQKLLKLVLIKKKEFSASEDTFIKSLRSIQSTYRSRNYKSQSGLADALRDDEGFLDIYETYIDILAIDRAFTALKKKLKGDKEKLEKFVNKVKQKQLPLGRIDKETGKEATIKLNSITAMKGRFGNDYSALNPRRKPASHPKELERYRELKMKATRMQKGSKDAKDMYKPEKVTPAALPQGKKGQVNIKKLIFQAFKGLNLDKDIMKDLEQRLNKKLQGVAKQYISKGMDVRVLEEKLTKYANSVVKQLNEEK